MHRGVAACARRGEPRRAADIVATARFLVVTESINDPENLGALFRNAAAFSVDGMLLDPTTCDPLSRRVIRVSMGHALRVPFARGPLPPLPGFTTVALTAGASTDIAEVRAERVALFVGNEGSGLSPYVLASADVRASIPMAKGVDSLNVATAAAVALALLRRGRE
jgi:tRNA G18 (ribose-2'-O)-methylase SpoU